MFTISLSGARYVLSTIIPNFFAATRNKTHGRVAPDWDLRRTLYRLSCTAGAKVYYFFMGASPVGTMMLMQDESFGLWQQPTEPWSRVSIRSWSLNFEKMAKSWLARTLGRFRRKVLLTSPENILMAL